MNGERRIPLYAMKSQRHYTLSIATDLAAPDSQTDWEGTLSVDRIVDATLVEAFRRTKLAPPRPEIRVNPALAAGQVELSTRDGLKGLFDTPGPAERWTLDPENVKSNGNSLLFGLQGRIVEQDFDDAAFSADRRGLLELLTAHLIEARGLTAADTGTLARLADGNLGNRVAPGDEPSPQAQALAQWARSMFAIGVPELSTVELLDVGISVGAQEADQRERAIRSGVERLAAGWSRLIAHQELSMIEVSAELCGRLSSKDPAERSRAQAALRGQLGLIMLRLPDALHRPEVLAIQAEADEDAAWDLLLHPDLAGLPKTSMAMADFSDVMHRRRCVLGAPESAGAKAA